MITSLLPAKRPAKAPPPPPLTASAPAASVSPTTRAEGEVLLRQMLGNDQQFRAGQWEAIQVVAHERRRALVVQRTGWGKSIVYFLATKILRLGGAGPTLLISPLLSLMRNQIQAAARLGLQAVTIHSENVEEWSGIERSLEAGKVDVLLVSPERLANPQFLQRLLPFIQAKVGLFAVDEAHCISDWGHDFRPDYRRIVRILQLLPPRVPVLCTTATANDRVVSDIESQISGLQVLRGPLVRPSLKLYTVKLPTPAQRLAWLADFLPDLPGSGIVYTLTIQDAERVADWLQHQGLAATAYHSDLAPELRVQAEEKLLKNELKALVATVALGMGFDKPDLGFVVHYQRPGSVVAYYQQVGRAGRALEAAYGILLSGVEDDDIQEFFIRSAFPPAKVLVSIYNALARESRTVDEIATQLNMNRNTLDKAVRLLEVEGAIQRDARGYSRKADGWKPDTARFEQVTAHRLDELEQIKQYLNHSGCLMEFLTRALDDPGSERCGKCMNCAGQTKRRSPTPETVREAEIFLGEESLIIAPRRQWPRALVETIQQRVPRAVERTADRQWKSSIPMSHRMSEGRLLWSEPVVFRGKKSGSLKELSEAKVVEEAARMIRERWKPASLRWVTAVPSLRRAGVVEKFAEQLARRLELPFHPVIRRLMQGPPQDEFQNSVLQLKNVVKAFEVRSSDEKGAVLLVDDLVGSKWTVTWVSALLRDSGVSAVHPFALGRRLTVNE